MHQFVDEYSQLSSAAEQNQYIAEMLSFAADRVSAGNGHAREKEALQEELKKTQEELRKTEARIESAKEYVRDLKAEAESADRRVRKEIYRNLQIVRDRVYAIIETSVAAGERVEENSRSKVSLTELNNIIVAVDTIIRELRTRDLWTELDAMPDVRAFKKKEPVRKKRTTETGPGGEKNKALQEDQIVLTME